MFFVEHEEAMIFHHDVPRSCWEQAKDGLSH